MSWLFEGVIPHQLISLLLFSTIIVFYFSEDTMRFFFSRSFSFSQNIFSFLEDKSYYIVGVI